MRAQRWSGPAARLLAVLCVTAGCAAGQQQQQQQPQEPSAMFNTTPDELLRFIEQAVRAELQPLVSKLESRVDALDSKLESRVDALDNRLGSRVDTLDSRLMVVDSRVEDLTFRLLENRQSPQPDEGASRLNSQNQKSQLDALISKVDGQKSQLDGLIAQVNRQKSQLEQLVAKVGIHTTQVIGLVAKMDNQKFEMAGMVTKLDSQQSQVDGLITKVDSQKSKLDGLAGRFDSQESQVTGLATKLGSQQSQLAALTATSSREQPQLAALTTTSSHGQPRDCSDLPSGAQSGIHLLQPGLDRSRPPVAAYCDLDNDGGIWTVIQRRDDIKPRQHFNLGWAAYKEGFGQLDAEFWWGLDHLWRMTSARDRQYELHVSLEDFEGQTRHAVYQGFRVSSEEDGYRLTLAEYSGDAGDSLRYHVNRKFTTSDKDQDSHPSSNCAKKFTGAWWYGACYNSNLNGPYQFNPVKTEDGIIAWEHWKGTTYSLKKVVMKIQSRNG